MKKLIYHTSLNELLPNNYNQYFDLVECTIPALASPFVNNISILTHNPLGLQKNWLLLPEVNPYLIIHAGAPVKKNNIQILYVGPRTKPATINRANRAYSLIIQLKIFGAVTMIPREIIRQCVDHPYCMTNYSDVFQKLAEELSCETTALQSVNILMEFLCTQLYGKKPTKLQTQINASLLSCRAVDDITKETGISERYLQKICNAGIGINPKKIIKLSRLHKAIQLAANSTPEQLNWAKIAYELNYADQSHLIDEFNEFLHISPAKFLTQFFTTA